MSNSHLKDVAEFNDSFGMYKMPSYTSLRNLSKIRPAETEKFLQILASLINEESSEFTEAAISLDEKELLDALIDLEYVVLGAVHRLGYGPVYEAAWAEVHRSNMSKLGPDGKPVLREDGKILKGPGFTPVKISVSTNAENRKCWKIGEKEFTP